MVLIASLSSVPPHIHPPIAQVPSAMREASRGNPAIFRYSIAIPFVLTPPVAPAVRQQLDRARKALGIGAFAFLSQGAGR